MKPAHLITLAAACAALSACIVVPDEHRGGPGRERDYRHEHRDDDRGRDRDRDYERRN